MDSVKKENLLPEGSPSLYRWIETVRRSWKDPIRASYKTVVSGDIFLFINGGEKYIYIYSVRGLIVYGRWEVKVAFPRNRGRSHDTIG